MTNEQSEEWDFNSVNDKESEIITHTVLSHDETIFLDS